MNVLMAFALAASNGDIAMSNWASCMSDYAMPRLQGQAVERIVDGGFAACGKAEKAVRDDWISQLGPQSGANMMIGIRYKVRQIMIRRVTQAKKLRGYR